MIDCSFFPIRSGYVQWYILGEASEAVAPPPFLKIPHIVLLCCIFFLKITLKLLQKVGNLRTNSTEDLFFRDHHEVGRKIGKYEIKDLFFKERQFLGILIKILPRAPNFEYPSLVT